jgi:hypothetical protein
MTTQSQVEDYLQKQEAHAFFHQNKDIMNTYASVVPSEMSQRDLQHMITELTTAKNWGLQEATIRLSNGMDYKVEVSRLNDYQQAHTTITSL